MHGTSTLRLDLICFPVKLLDISFGFIFTRYFLLTSLIHQLHQLHVRFNHFNIKTKPTPIILKYFFSPLVYCNVVSLCCISCQPECSPLFLLNWVLLCGFLSTCVSPELKQKLISLSMHQDVNFLRPLFCLFIFVIAFAGIKFISTKSVWKNEEKKWLLEYCCLLLGCWRVEI